jgi:hypothetical protein
MRLQQLLLVALAVTAAACAGSDPNIDGQGRGELAQKVGVQEQQLQQLGYTLVGVSGPGTMSFDNTLYYAADATAAQPDSLGSYQVTTNHNLSEATDAMAYVGPYQTRRGDGDFVTLVVQSDSAAAWVVVSQAAVQPGAIIPLSIDGAFAVFQWAGSDGQPAYALAITGTLTITDGTAVVGARVSGELLAEFTPIKVESQTNQQNSSNVSTNQPATSANAVALQQMGYTVGDSGPATATLEGAYAYTSQDPNAPKPDKDGTGSYSVNIANLPPFNHTGIAYVVNYDVEKFKGEMVAVVIQPTDTEYLYVVLPAASLIPGAIALDGQQSMGFFSFTADGQAATALSVTGTLTISAGNAQPGSLVSATLDAEFTRIFEQQQPTNNAGNNQPTNNAEPIAITDGEYTLTLSGDAPYSVQCGGQLQGSEGNYSTMTAGQLGLTISGNAALTNGDKPTLSGDFVMANFRAESIPFDWDQSGWISTSRVGLDDGSQIQRELYLQPSGNGAVSAWLGADIVPSGYTSESFCRIWFAASFMPVPVPIAEGTYSLTIEQAPVAEYAQCAGALAGQEAQYATVQAAAVALVDGALIVGTRAVGGDFIHANFGYDGMVLDWDGYGWLAHGWDSAQPVVVPTPASQVIDRQLFITASAGQWAAWVGVDLAPSGAAAGTYCRLWYRSSFDAVR